MTFAFLVRWHFWSFFGGLAMAGFTGYQLWTYVPPKPSAMDTVTSAPFAEFFVPLMCIGLLTGSLSALNALRKVWADAH